MVVGTKPSRHYRGSSAEQRAAERRERFVRTAIRLYAERGFRNISVKALCTEVGLTERYFYESFANREAVLIAALDAVVPGLIEQVAAAPDVARPASRERLQKMLTAYYTALQVDPSSARVFLVEIRGVSTAVDAALDAALARLGGVFAGVVAGGSGDPIALAGIIGATEKIALAWIASGYERAVEHVTDVAIRACLALLPALPSN